MQQLPQPPSAEEAKRLIERLVRYAMHNGMLAPLDESYARNALIDLFRFAEPAPRGAAEAEPLASRSSELLEPLLDYAASIGLLEDNTMTYRDLLDARIMGLLMPRPSETAEAYRSTAAVSGIEQATDAFYKLNVDANYIRLDRVEKNEYWKQPTGYGELEITINLSKPEKDPREIALLKTLPPSGYPRCLLCADNVGYAGRANHPARQNLRILPLTLQDERWYFQYSPYVYYNEHCIVFKGEHVPMRISPVTFARLLDFLEQYPHYFVGSNADLPIVGGSILDHDHFQGGRHTFAMAKAPLESVYSHPAYPGVTMGIVQWPMSVVRLNGLDRASVHAAACSLLEAWTGYSDPEADVAAYSTGVNGESVPHNTVTPIARRTPDGGFELDLVLRNNRVSAEHPDGIFHPHRHLHHIKKENIGLIEVMGLAVLPGRLKDETAQIAAYLTGAVPYDAQAVAAADHPLAKHAPWIAQLVDRCGTSLTAEQAGTVLRDEVGRKFEEVLLDAGVFKQDEPGRAAFAAFMGSAGLVRRQ
jgi:UDPglucose--hexose-1-phosphate uridylyltransferase